VDVARVDVDGPGQLPDVQLVADVVDEIRKRAERQRPSATVQKHQSQTQTRGREHVHLFRMPIMGLASVQRT
jgi:hypothetical protein